MLTPFSHAQSTLTADNQTIHFKNALEKKGTWLTDHTYQFFNEAFEFSMPLALLNPMCWKPAFNIACDSKLDAAEVHFLLYKNQNPDVVIEGRCITVWYLNYDAEKNPTYFTDIDRANHRFNVKQDNITVYEHFLEISDCKIYDDPMPTINDKVYSGRTPFDKISTGFLRHSWKTEKKLEFE